MGFLGEGGKKWLLVTVSNSSLIVSKLRPLDGRMVLGRDGLEGLEDS
jgi:hypothetical protein